MRTEVTKIINQTIERIPGNDPRTNSYVVNEAAAVLNTTASHGIKKHKSSFNDDIIFEQAVTRCGTQQPRSEPVSNGSVNSEARHVNCLKCFYKFPCFTINTKEYWAAVEEQWEKMAMKFERENMQPEEVAMGSSGHN